jgi:3-oxoacyl-[acyl-carrier-protein] synthase III
MASKRYTPIVIGVGDLKNKSTKIEDAIEPLHLMLQATHRAIKDTDLAPASLPKLQSSIDSIAVVATWTWNYPDLPGLVAEKLGVKPKYKVLSHHGGDSPAKLFDEAARRISFGGSRVALVTGGEALASCKLSLISWSFGIKENMLTRYSRSIRSSRQIPASRMDSSR